MKLSVSNAISSYLFRLVFSTCKKLRNDTSTLENSGKSRKINEQETVKADYQSSCCQFWLVVTLLALLFFASDQHLWDFSHLPFDWTLIVLIDMVFDFHQYRHLNTQVSVFHNHKKKWCFILLRKFIIGSEKSK